MCSFFCVLLFFLLPFFFDLPVFLVAFFFVELDAQAIQDIEKIIESHKHEQVIEQKLPDFDESSEEPGMDEEKMEMEIEMETPQNNRRCTEYLNNRFSKYILRFQKQNMWEMDDRFEKDLMPDFKTNKKGKRVLDVLIVRCVENCMFSFFTCLFANIFVVFFFICLFVNFCVVFLFTKIGNPCLFMNICQRIVYISCIF